MIKEQAGVEEFDASAAGHVLLDVVKEALGILSEVIEESSQRLVMRIGRCPLYESAQEVGVDAETSEGYCRACDIGYMDTMVKQLNPELSYQLMKFRSTENAYCEEAVVLA